MKFILSYMIFIIKSILKLKIKSQININNKNKLITLKNINRSKKLISKMIFSLKSCP